MLVRPVVEPESGLGRIARDITFYRHVSEPNADSGFLPVCPGLAPAAAAAHLWSCFPPGSIPDSYTPEMYITERNILQDAAFRAVLPLPGALEIVRTLKERGVKIALATGSNEESFKMKTVSLDSSRSCTHMQMGLHC